MSRGLGDVYKRQGEGHMLMKLVAFRETLAGDLLIDYEKMERRRDSARRKFLLCDMPRHLADVMLGPKEWTV